VSRTRETYRSSKVAFTRVVLSQGGAPSYGEHGGSNGTHLDGWMSGQTTNRQESEEGEEENADPTYLRYIKDGLLSIHGAQALLYTFRGGLVIWRYHPSPPTPARAAGPWVPVEPPVVDLSLPPTGHYCQDG